MHYGEDNGNISDSSQFASSVSVYVYLSYLIDMAN